MSFQSAYQFSLDKVSAKNEGNIVCCSSCETRPVYDDLAVCLGCSLDIKQMLIAICPTCNLDLELEGYCPRCFGQFTPRTQ